MKKSKQTKKSAQEKSALRVHIKKAQREQIENSRQIGKAKSGKDIHSCFQHPLHVGFDESDHLDAMAVHMDIANELNESINSVQLSDVDPYLLQMVEKRNLSKGDDKLTNQDIEEMRIIGPMYYHLDHASRHRHAASKFKQGNPLPADTYWPDIADEVRHCRLRRPRDT